MRSNGSFWRRPAARRVVPFNGMESETTKTRPFPTPTMSPTGLLIIDKPAGMTSHDVVDRVRRLFRTKRVGHTGTLDPQATGVLVVCLGQATRLAEFLSAAKKHYRSEIVFGIETDTEDAWGQTVSERDATDVTAETVEQALSRFRGKIDQVPPMVSALHHAGKRLYELAREGVTVERASRAIEITELTLTHFEPGMHPVATLEITCSTGTYIRTLAADIGHAVGSGAMMRALRRTWVGQDEQVSFPIHSAETLEGLTARAEAGTLDDVLLPLGAAVTSWPQAWLGEAAMIKIRQGQVLEPARLADAQLKNWNDSAHEDMPIAIFDLNGILCGVGQVAAGSLRPVKVLAYA